MLADEVKGKITKVDPDKKVITVSIDGKDTEYAVADDCKMPKARMKKNDPGGEAKTTEDVLAEIRGLAQGGAFGSIVGRNSFQRPKDEAIGLLHEIMDIYTGAKILAGVNA